MKTAFECSHVKSVRAWGLVYQGNVAGAVVANYSDNKSGSVATVTINVYYGPIAMWRGHLPDMPTGKCGGAGIDKFAVAFHSALHQLPNLPKSESERKMNSTSEIRNFFESHGYIVVEVI